MATKKKRDLKKMNTALPPELVAALHDYVEESGTKLQTVMALAIRSFLRRAGAMK